MCVNIIHPQIQEIYNDRFTTNLLSIPHLKREDCQFIFINIRFHIIYLLNIIYFCMVLYCECFFREKMEWLMREHKMVDTECLIRKALPTKVIITWLQSTWYNSLNNISLNPEKSNPIGLNNPEIMFFSIILTHKTSSFSFYFRRKKWEYLIISYHRCFHC